MARSQRTRRDEVARIIERADIAIIAGRLGLNIDGRNRQPRRAICPFHDDKDPSLNLYRGGSKKAERDHYHCFVCGAHGDVVSLIQNIEHLTFWEAIKRLAEIEGTTLSSTHRSKIERTSGTALLEEKLKAAATSDLAFTAFAERRGYTAQFLRDSGAAQVDLSELIETARKNRVVEEQLVEAGIIRRDHRAPGSPDLYGLHLRGFFKGQRVVFPIENHRRSVIGFAARSLADDKPKYLYTYDFPRRTSLFGEGRLVENFEVQRRAHDRSPIDLFLVEGIFDVLRLAQFGFHALGILGSNITSGQIDGLKRIIDIAETGERELRIHIFFDRDDAGRRGAYDATIRLLGLLQDTAPFALAVIWPAETEGKLDPDMFLLGQTEQRAPILLKDASVSPLQFLAAFHLSVEPRHIDWANFSRLHLASVARRIALALPKTDWSRITALLALDSEDAGLSDFATFVSSYGGGAPQQAGAIAALNRFRDPVDDRANLLKALTLGRSSTMRREYPLDNDAWERLAIAASPLFHIHCARLKAADGPSGPLLARHMPKGGGRYRLKAGPVPQDALLQQYALVELLRDRDDCPQFTADIPAVRYSHELPPDESIYRTGTGDPKQPLSFAYQIDMSIVNGLTPPRREGIFRPYFECWRSFIEFLEDRIKRFRHEELQILRLDITGFYDYLRRDVVAEALAKPLELALQRLNVASGDVSSFAPLFAPLAIADAADRSEKFTNFILSHSFGCEYLDPETGCPEGTDSRRGIPQGPDLSAYLATISLFDLDDMMELEIDRLNQSISLDPDTNRFAATYARYVDDIVIICKDIETASQLRRKVESNIALKGLSLNRKNPTPPPMTRAEARAWISDNRSGFGFSGPLADLPSTDAMDPLADSGEIDRKTALGLIYDPDLDNPDNASISLKKIGAALNAPDIRFNDRASAYRRLWSLAAHEMSEGSGTVLAERFWNFLTSCEPRFVDLASEHEKLDIGLAWLEGLDRALRVVIPPSALADNTYARTKSDTQKLAASALDNVFSPLAIRLLGPQGAAKMLARYDVRCQIGIIACLSAEAVEDRGAEFQFSTLHNILKPSDATTLALPTGLQVSLLKFDATFSTSVQENVVPRQYVGPAFARLNRTIVQLQRVAAYDDADEEPPVYVAPDASDPTDIVRISSEILQVWSPNDQPPANGTTSTEVELDAASTLVNITYKVFAGVAERRARLRYLIAGTPEVIPLPSPPGLRASGILLWCNDGRLLLASTDGSDGSKFDPVGITWSEGNDAPVSGVHLRHANLPKGYRLLVDGNPTWDPAQIVALYRAGFPLFTSQIELETETVPVPTAFSFYAKADGDNVDFSSLKLISWSAPRESVDGHAFVRSGGTLEARSVFSEGSNLWRFGWAVRDVCNRVDVLPDDEAGVDDHAGTTLEKDSHRREAMIARILPRLSGADRWGPGDASPEDPIPSRVNRALTLLENFATAESAADAAYYLVAAVAEGIFMSERINAHNDLTLPGQPAALMARSARRVSRALPEAAKHWDVALPSSLPYRRTAAAWQIISEHIANNDAITSGAADSLRVLQQGMETLAAIADLRSLAFELTATLPPDSIELLESSKFDLGWVSEIVGLDLVLLDSGNALTDISIERQTRSLITAFCQIVFGRRGGLNIQRDGISPAGWVIIVAILLQVVSLRQIESDKRPNLWKMNITTLRDAEEALHTLLRYFASSSDTITNSENWPWDVFDNLTKERPKDMPALLRQITDAAGIHVTNEQSWTNPRTGDVVADRPIMRLADGNSLSLAEWQIDVAYIKGERGTTTEAFQTRSRMRFSYSISRQGDQIIGMHLVSRQLGEAAFGSSQISVEQLPPDSSNKFRSADDASQRDTVPTFSNPMQDEKPNQEIDTEQPFRSGMTGDADVSYILSRIDSARIRSWDNRKKSKNQGTQRVALVQWDVTDTYQSPGYKGGLPEGLFNTAGDKSATISEVRNGGVFLSSTEHRRRALIKEVLTACARFGVDGLIFPEYSLRPETINWLSRQLKQQALPITVWCGTFRVPNGTQLDFDFSSKSTAPYLSPIGSVQRPGINRWEYHTAILTCLRAVIGQGTNIQVEHYARQKRYPSAAASELIRPPIDQPWHPLLENETNPFQIGTFTLELVCAEMFPHASSANFIGIVEENRELADQYGLGPKGQSMFKHISEDIFEFAKWTASRNVKRVSGDPEGALIRGERLQRTLIVLPAMSNRSADFHVFGQNQYLAAGLVTAFCNAVAPSMGCGQSGFIGLDGWKITDGLHTPYGSKSPGIFQLGGDHSGTLGESEAAMVIADIDLLRPADQRPRPHYQDRPLRLVAHLPIFFATEAGRDRGDETHPNNLRHVRRRLISGKSNTFVEALNAIDHALSVENDWRSQGNVAQAGEYRPPTYESAITATIDALKVLEEFADDPVWLKKRSASFIYERYIYPPLFPLPALVDWIYVDDRWTPGSIPEEATGENKDPLDSDRPVLMVPKSMQDEPHRRPD